MRKNFVNTTAPTFLVAIAFLCLIATASAKSFTEAYFKNSLGNVDYMDMQQMSTVLDSIDVNYPYPKMTECVEKALAPFQNVTMNVDLVRSALKARLGCKVEFFKEEKKYQLVAERRSQQEITLLSHQDINSMSTEQYRKSVDEIMGLLPSSRRDEVMIYVIESLSNYANDNISGFASNQFESKAHSSVGGMFDETEPSIPPKEIFRSLVDAVRHADNLWPDNNKSRVRL